MIWPSSRFKMSSSRSSSVTVGYTRLIDDEDPTVHEGKVSGIPASVTSNPESPNNPGSTNPGSYVSNYSDAVEVAGFGRFHVLLLIVCGWANMSDTLEILSVSFLLPRAKEDMNINSFEQGLLTSIIFMGMLVGGYFWGSMADVQGRRRILIFSLLCNAVFGFCSSLCQTYWLFLVMRFLSGVGVGGSIPVIFSYFSEFQPTKHRGAMISGLSTFWMFGNIVTAALAWAIIPRKNLNYSVNGFKYDSWRIFVAVCCIPAATSVITYMFMPESPKFLLEKGEEEKALEVMKQIYCWNHRNAQPEDYPIRHLIPSCKEDKSLLRGRKSLFRATIQLFKPPLVKLMLSMMVIIFSLSFGYYGLWMWFPELFKRVEYSGAACGEYNHSAANPEDDSQIYADGFYTSLSNLPGNILTIVLMDKVGRKLLLGSSLLLSGVSVFFIWFLRSRTQVLIMSIVFGAISVVSWNTLNVVGVELFPTSCRSTALGVQSVCNRIGAILGSLLFGILIDLHCSIPMIMIAVLLAVGGLVTTFLPNTTRIELK